MYGRRDGVPWCLHIRDTLSSSSTLVRTSRNRCSTRVLDTITLRTTLIAGSTSFGQGTIRSTVETLRQLHLADCILFIVCVDFTDAINKDWGGKPFVDLKKGWDHILGRYPEIDTDRTVAMGGSWGGYAIKYVICCYPLQTPKSSKIADGGFRFAVDFFNPKLDTRSPGIRLQLQSGRMPRRRV